MGKKVSSKRKPINQVFDGIKLPIIEGKKDVFISYKRENAKYVSRLFTELNEHDIDAWFDLNELHQDVGKEYTERIHNGIDNSEYFLLIYTKDVEDSEFIIKEELGHAVEKKKTILFYPKDSIDISKSKLKEYVEKIQWLDTEATAIHQPDTQESITDEKRLQDLSALINEKHGKSVFEDESLFLIRIALQRLLGKITVFGNYKKLCGIGANEFYDNKLFNLSVINKGLFIDAPQAFKEKLEKLNFYRKDKVQEVERHISIVKPEKEELLAQFKSFLKEHKDKFSLPILHERLKNYLVVGKYKSIVLPDVDLFDTDAFIDIVRSMVACTFISDLEAGKTMFNGAELGVFSITDNRITNSEEHCVDMKLYYSDYFTFKCMTEMYHILCSIDGKPFDINNTQDIKHLAPFLCSIGLGGFVAAYINGKPSLMWTKRSGNISSGDIWHFSYDETVSLLMDGIKDNDNHLMVDDNGTAHIDINNILFRALKEEVGVTQARIEKFNHGLFEVGIIKSERLEIELISQAVIHLQESPSPQEQIKEMHDSASDGYLEISKVKFFSLRNRDELIGHLLTPESYAIYTRMQERLIDNVGRDVKLGCNLMIEEGSRIDDGAEIGDECLIESYCHIGRNSIIGRKCKIHRNVYIDDNVSIGSYVKIQNNNSIYEGVTLKDGVFVGTNVCFTNDLYPRSIRKSDGMPVTRKDWEMKYTVVERGASIGAGAVIRCGVTIGEWAMVGCGAVVLEDVPAGATVVGNPAKIVISQEKLK